ncbi:MAG: TIGR00730 family Rossman fold protein [Chitinophagaceae bacterium]
MADHRKPVVAVFCGSKSGTDPQFLTDAATLGALLAQNGFDIVYGGASVGMMGALANNAIANGGRVTGVIPEVLVAWERQHKGLSELIVTKDMHIRKKTMYEMCSAAIILPGGYGTLDELFEMLTWNQLSIHDKKIYILNTAGFYNHLILHMESLGTKGFLYEPTWTRLIHFEKPVELVEAIRKDLGAV